MPIQYRIRSNRLVSDEETYSAFVLPIASLGFEEIADKMAEHGSTTTRADILAVMEDILVTVRASLVEGYRVNFGDLVQLFPSITGKFEGTEDSFDPSRHKVKLNAVAGRKMNAHLRDRARIEKLPALPVGPRPTEIIDGETWVKNATVVSGGVVTLNGVDLNYDPEAADEGVFFISRATHAETQMSLVVVRRPAQLIFRIPAFPAGEIYDIEVRARMGRIDLRSGRLPWPVTILGTPE